MHQTIETVYTTKEMDNQSGLAFDKDSVLKVKKVASTKIAVVIAFLVLSVSFVLVSYSVLNVTLFKYYRTYFSDQKITSVVENVDELKSEPGENSRVMSRYVILADPESDFDALDGISEVLENSTDSYFNGVLILGDLTSFGTVDDLDRYKQILTDYKVQLYVIPGDRDLYASKGLNNFSNIFKDSYYYLEKDKLLFIDNADEYDGISDKQFEFIVEHIDKTDFVFLHNPIYFSDSLIDIIAKKGMGQYSKSVDEQRVRLLKIIRDSNVKAVFAGDRHVYTKDIDKEDSELVFYVIGSLNNDRSIGGSSYAILTIYDDSTYNLETVRLTN